jgi:hypothetical protein
MKFMQICNNIQYVYSFNKLIKIKKNQLYQDPRIVPTSYTLSSVIHFIN